MILTYGTVYVGAVYTASLQPGTVLISEAKARFALQPCSCC